METTTKQHCLYCKHHKMAPSGPIGWGTCTGGGDIEQRSTMHHQPFDLLVGYHFGDVDRECSEFVEKDHRE